MEGLIQTHLIQDVEFAMAEQGKCSNSYHNMIKRQNVEFETKRGGDEKHLI